MNDLEEKYNNLVDKYNEAMQMLALSESINHKQIKTLKGEVVKLKAQVNGRGTTRVESKSKKLQRLESQLKLAEEVVHKSAIYVGKHKDNTQTLHHVFDDGVCTMKDKDVVFKAHRLLVVNHFGVGRVVYRRLDTNQILPCELNQETEFNFSTESVEYYEKYFNNYKPSFYAKAQNTIR